MNLDQLIFIWKGRHLVLALFASSIKEHLLLIKQKQENSKMPERVRMKHSWKPEATKMHVPTYF